MEKVVELARKIFESPKFAAALYAGAVIAVFATMELREEE